MLRREFIAGAATVALSARPLRAHAQSATRRTRIGVLIYGSPERNPSTQTLLEGFRELGYVDGQNLTIEYRYAQGRPERLPELAADLVQSKPVVIFAIGGDVTPHVVKATQSIPIIYAMSADPVQLGIAKSLAKPGGNATGVTFLSDQLAAKRLETFKEAAPRIARVAARPRSQPCRQRTADRRARSKGLEARVAAGRNPRSFRTRPDTRDGERKPASTVSMSYRRGTRTPTRLASSSSPTGIVYRWWLDGVHGSRPAA